MSRQEIAAGGLNLRRRFERSRLQEELVAAVYDTLLAVLVPQETPVVPSAADEDGAGRAAEDADEGALARRATVATLAA